MKRTISEYEFSVVRNGTKQTVQQSEFTKVKAEKRIKSKIKGIDKIKFKKKLSYPHLEKGLKVK